MRSIVQAGIIAEGVAYKSTEEMLTGNAAVLNQGGIYCTVCVYLLMKQFNLIPKIDPSLDRMQQCCIYTSHSTKRQEENCLQPCQACVMETHSRYCGVDTIDLLLCGIARLKRENARNA